MLRVSYSLRLSAGGSPRPWHPELRSQVEEDVLSAGLPGATFEGVLCRGGGVGAGWGPSMPKEGAAAARAMGEALLYFLHMASPLPCTLTLH